MESTRIQSIAIQIGVAEDIEQRRRCMHLQEEALKQKGAQQVSGLVRTGLVSLNHVEPVVKSLPLSDATRVKRNVRRAGRVAAVPLQKAADVGRAVTSAAGNAIQAAAALPVAAAHKAADTTANAAHKGAEVASDVGHATANATANATNAVLNKASDLGHATANTAASAANTAADLGHATANAAAGLGHATVNAAADLGRATANTAASAANAAADLGHATANTAAAAAHKVADTTANVAHAAADTASTAAHVAADTAKSAAHIAADTTARAAHMVADTTASALSTAADIGSAAAHVAANTAVSAGKMAVGAGEVAAENAAIVAQEAAEAAKPVAKSLFSKAVDLGYRAAGFGSEMASSALHKAADVGSQVLASAGDYANHAMTAAHRTFLHGQEEIERLRRQTSEMEHWAILNAYKTAQCLRGWLQSKNLNIPLSGRNVEAYLGKLLEEVERIRRAASPLTSKKNMNKIATMLKDTRFNPVSPHCLTAMRWNPVSTDNNYFPALEAYRNLPGPIATATPIETPVSAPIETVTPIETLRSAPIETAAPIEIPRSAPVVPVAPVESVLAHHVPASAVNAAPFVPPSAQPQQVETPVVPHQQAQTPVTYLPLPVTANGGSFAIPQLDLTSLGGLSGNGAPVVVFYPVMAQSAPLDASTKATSSSATAEQPLGRAAM